MTDRQEERLAELLEQTGMLDSKSRCRIAAEELLANGVILLPLPIGSTVYEIRAKGERSYKHRKFDYGIPTNFALHSAIEMGAELYIAPKKFTKTNTVRLNKTVFLTKEEAETKLKELNK